MKIIAYWHKEHPRAIDLDLEENVPWLSANWVEYRPATQEEVEMYRKGVFNYFIKD
jgi:hypothetical protein